jgi:lipopolysaccharide export LptBFGC system permease protein LptF
MLNTIGTILLFTFFAFLGVMYIRNLLKIAQALKLEDYGITTIARIIGVFVFPAGVVMGFV